jgi:hypothetical protein
MPKLTNPTINDTCFLCGCQAFYISFNSKRLRCVEKISRCPGHAAKAEAVRQQRMSKADRIEHMKLMSKNGNATLKKLHADEGWRRVKGHNISVAKTSILEGRKDEWILYESIVDRITRESWIYHKEKINPDNLFRGKDYELDHMYSKHQGFLNNVPADIIGHYANLKLITRHSNRQKYNKCSITLDELYSLIGINSTMPSDSPSSLTVIS